VKGVFLCSVETTDKNMLSCGILVFLDVSSIYGYIFEQPLYLVLEKNICINFTFFFSDKKILYWSMVVNIGG